MDLRADALGDPFGEDERRRSLAERAGFQREGVLRAFTREWGAPIDNLIYSALPGDPAWA